MDMLIQGVEFLNEINSSNECYYFKIEPEDYSTTPLQIANYKNTTNGEQTQQRPANSNQHQQDSSSVSSSPVVGELSVSTSLSASQSSSSLASSQSTSTEYNASSTASNCRFIKQSFPFSNSFPYILVNIGSGVSILLVKSEKKYKRLVYIFLFIPFCFVY